MQTDGYHTSGWSSTHDEEAWEQYYDVATVARWSPVNRGRRSRAGDVKSVP